ncbi:hypothetical protein DYD21_12735 [Rhodohalobacter sp. SW132]|uniref:porin n=1 Tax=Rhodohalobacter sp. SW132 TaxID=2293433 RepID=UPI000E27AD3A|nr:porin [Rhodohalobacter sp. SW132]REL33117.1 hypothetical protein DYD21_12735 [Rhodohalobacter sp. SW132]
MIQNSMRGIILFILVMVLSFGTVQAQDQEPLTNEMQNLLKSEPFNVGLLLQSTANFSLTDDGFNGGRRFGLGATRLRFGGAIDGGFDYVLQMDFRRTSSVVDAAVGYRSSEQFYIKSGLQKPDIGLDLAPNPGRTDFISRARLIGVMLNTREVGVSASGNFDNFDYNIAIFNGTGYSLNNDDRFMYLAKFGYNVDMGNNRSLYWGANGALNTTQGASVGNSGLTSREDRLIYGAFAKYDSESWFGAAELLMTSFDTPGVGDETITGAYVTIGNKVTDRDELLARVDHIGYNEIDSSTQLFILGWNRQVTSLISVQLNALGLTGDGDESFGLAANFQFQF